MSKYTKILVGICLADLVISLILFKYTQAYESGFIYRLYFGSKVTLLEIAYTKIIYNYVALVWFEVHLGYRRYIDRPILRTYYHLLYFKGRSQPNDKVINRLGRTSVYLYPIVLVSASLVMYIFIIK